MFVYLDRGLPVYQVSRETRVIVVSMPSSRQKQSEDKLVLKVTVVTLAEKGYQAQVVHQARKDLLVCPVKQDYEVEREIEDTTDSQAFPERLAHKA